MKDLIERLEEMNRQAGKGGGDARIDKASDGVVKEIFVSENTKVGLSDGVMIGE